MSRIIGKSLRETIRSYYIAATSEVNDSNEAFTLLYTLIPAEITTDM